MQHRAESWNAWVEQQVSANLAVHVAYVGAESYHQTTVIDQNPGDSVQIDDEIRLWVVDGIAHPLPPLLRI